MYSLFLTVNWDKYKIKWFGFWIACVLFEPGLDIINIWYLKIDSTDIKQRFYWCENLIYNHFIIYWK